MGTKPRGERTHPKETTPTFLLELPLVVEAGQAARLRAHLEAGRQFYNAVLSAGQHRLRQMRADTGLRFVLQKPEEGNQGYLICKDDQLMALIDWKDPVVKYGLEHRIKYARLLQRKVSSPQAQGADALGFRYSVQLALEGVPYRKPKHSVGSDTIGADLGPSTIALVPREAEASLSLFCQELAPDEQAVRRLQRKMDRQRRAANPDNYDSLGRIKKHGGKRGEKGKVVWKSSKTYQKTRRRKAAKERRLAAHRKSLHGRLVHEIVAVGNTIILEKISYKAWQKQYGKSVGLRAPGMFIELLRRTVARTGGTLSEVSTRTTNAGSTRAYPTTRECGASLAPKLWYPQSRSASARKSERSHTRAAVPLQGEKEKRGSAAQNPPCLSRGSLQFAVYSAILVHDLLRSLAIRSMILL
jgi:hypothetical protein